MADCFPENGVRVSGIHCSAYLRPLRAWPLALFVAWSVASLSGCASIQAIGPGKRADHARVAVVQELWEDRAELSQTAVRRMLRESEADRLGCEPNTFDVLMISGGGEWGAFGAGVLQGWGIVSDPLMRRPTFDVVTGVSTGALIAPMAFVGTPETYDRVFQAYQNPREDWFQRRLLTAVLLGRPSLFDNAGLARDVRATLDDPIVEGIASGAAEDRVLLVGTVNLNHGVMRMWNLTREAQRVVSGQAPRERIYDIVLASTSIPGVFPPVQIDGDLHVDGGVMRNIADVTDQNSQHSAWSIWKRNHPDRRMPRIRYWVIINNQLATPPEAVQPKWSTIAERSLGLAVRSSTLWSLKSLALATRLVRFQEGVDVEFRFLAIPDDWRPPVEGYFERDTMVSLAQLGFQLGADPRSWRTDVPDPESPAGLSVDPPDF